jgi:hypothetical protein
MLRACSAKPTRRATAALWSWKDRRAGACRPSASCAPSLAAVLRPSPLGPAVLATGVPTRQRVGTPRTVRAAPISGARARADVTGRLVWQARAATATAIGQAASCSTLALVVDGSSHSVSVSLALSRSRYRRSCAVCATGRRELAAGRGPGQPGGAVAVGAHIHERFCSSCGRPSYRMDPQVPKEARHRGRQLCPQRSAGAASRVAET